MMREKLERKREIVMAASVLDMRELTVEELDSVSGGVDAEDWGMAVGGMAGGIVGQRGGAVAGMYVGAAIGSLGGPLGTLAGAGIGALIGSRYGNINGGAAGTIAGGDVVQTFGKVKQH